MALSAAAHHSYDKVAAGAKYDGLRAQKTDRAGEAAHRAPRRLRTRAAGDAVFFELFDEDTAGVRPGVLAEPRPQERVHTLSTSSAARLWCRFSTLQCRRWWNSCQTCSGSSTGLRRFTSRLSKCPISSLRTSLCARFCVLRSWQNSWWKCRRSFLFPRCSGIWSKASTSRFLVVEGESLVFKVFFPDRVQQRCMVPRNAFLSGLWSRTLISLFVKASKIFSLDSSSTSSSSPAGFHGSADGPGAGVFRTFP